MTPEFPYDPDATLAGKSASAEQRPTVDLPADYDCLRELGRGGMGVVYQARHLQLNRVVALKMILAGSHASESELLRFLGEAESVAALQHANIVQIYEIARHRGLPYFTLEYVAGGSLAERVRENPLPPEEAASFVEQLARGVQYAHEQGIVHRDIKPENVLLAADGTPKLTDFGLAKRLKAGEGLTQTGAVMGTPSYMSPEQATGSKDVGPATDVYALGSVLYRVLTGRPPFLAATVIDTLSQVLNRDPVAPRELIGGVPRDLETICLKCLAKEPAKRYASAGELADDLGRFRRRESIVARPLGPVGRAAKWTRRNPKLVATLALIAGLVTVGTAGVVWQWREAVHQAGIAKKRSEEADDQRKQAQLSEQAAKYERDRAERSLYPAQVGLAVNAWRDTQIPRMRDLLINLRPRQDTEDQRGFEYYYLWRLAHAERLAFATPTGVVGMHLGPNSVRVVGTDGLLSTLDTKTGESPRIALRAKLPLAACEFSATAGRAVALGLSPQTIQAADRVGEVYRWELDATPPVLKTTAFPFPPRRVAVDADAKRFAVAWDDKDLAQIRTPSEIALYDFATGEQVRAWPKQHGQVTAMALRENTLAAGFRDGQVVLFDAESGKEQGRIQRPNGEVTALTFTPDGGRLIGGGIDGAIQVWELPSRSLVGELRGHAGAVTSLRCNAGGAVLVSGSSDQTARLWNLTKSQPIAEVKGPGAAVTDAAMSADGRELITVANNAVRVWDVTQPRESRVLRAGGSVYHLAQDTAHRRVAAANAFGVLTEFDVDTGRPSFNRLGFKSLRSAAYSPDGEWLVVGSEDGEVFRRRGAEWRPSFRGHVGPAFDMVFHPNRPQVASLGELLESNVRGKLTHLLLWNPETLAVEHEIRHPEAIDSLAYSPDGSKLATGHRHGFPILWDTRTGRKVFDFEGLRHNGKVSAVAFSPDGKRIVTGAQNSVKLWDAETGRMIATWMTPGRAMRCAAFSPDGKRIATSENSGVVTLWEAETGLEVLTLPGHTSFGMGVQFTPDGRRLVSANFDGTVRVWEGTDPPQVAELRRRLAAVEATFRVPAGDRKDWVAEVVGGTWAVEGVEVAQTQTLGSNTLLFGDPAWGDYDFEVECQLSDGRNGPTIVFRAADAANSAWFLIGSFGNTRHDMQQLVTGRRTALAPTQVPGTIEVGKWYRARVEVRGAEYRCLLDGVLVFEGVADQHHHGMVGLQTYNGTARFRNPKVTAPDGTVLLEGLPRLPAAGEWEAFQLRRQIAALLAK